MKLWEEEEEGTEDGGSGQTKSLSHMGGPLALVDFRRGGGEEVAGGEDKGVAEGAAGLSLGAECEILRRDEEEEEGDNAERGGEVEVAGWRLTDEKSLEGGGNKVARVGSST